MQAYRCAPAAGLRGLTGLRAAAASIVLFALLGVGHVLPALHFALVVHRICAEHGELLHEAPAVPAVESRSSDVQLVAGQHAGHAHEHCGVLALPGSTGSLPSVSWCEPLVLDGSLALLPPGERPAQGGISVLSYAPKLPPPV